MRPPASLLSLLPLTLTFAGCVAPDPSLVPQPTQDPMAPIDVQALAREVARVRGVKVVHPVAVRTLPGWIMSQRVLSRDLPDVRRSASDGTAAGTFGFAPPGTSLAGTERTLLAHGIAGYYDMREKVLFIRDAMGDATRVMPQAPGDRDVLAHEITHALQDQNFTLRLDGGPGADAEERLAYRALVEGDARLTELGVHAAARHEIPHWVSRAAWGIARALRGEVPKGRGDDAEKLRAEVGSAPLYVRRVLEFPYLDGALFVANLHRAGGSALVDVAFAHPPRTTEQILHPDKYVAGEGAVPVATPTAPDGWHLTEKGTLGELQASVLLAQCLPREEADRAAAGWGGDAWSVLADDADHRAIAWSTAWDDETAAARFESVARGRGACLQAASLDPRVGREVTVMREGTRVAYVQGLPEALREPVARSLLALPGQAPAPQPPAGDVTVPPLIAPDADFAHKGVYEGETWSSEPLGMRAELPQGFVAADAGGAEAAMIDKEAGGFVTFGIIFRAARRRARAAAAARHGGQRTPRGRPAWGGPRLPRLVHLDAERPERARAQVRRRPRHPAALDAHPGVLPAGDGGARDDVDVDAGQPCPRPVAREVPPTGRGLPGVRRAAAQRLRSVKATQGPQNPKSLPLAFEAVQVLPASVVQSAFFSQTVMPGAGHEVTHWVPVKLDHSGHVTPQWVAVVGVPVPQQMGPPASAAAQSMASSHCQSTEPATGQGVPLATQVEGVPAEVGVSQQCWPAAQVMSLPLPTALNGQ